MQSTLLSMFQSPIASAELGATPFTTQLGGKTAGVKGTGAKGGDGVDGKFADVLGLVSNMELADSQDVMGKDALKADLGQVQDAKIKAMQAQLNAAQISQLGQMQTNGMVALNGEGIGRQATAEIAPGSAGATVMGVTAGDQKSQMAAQVLLDGMQNAKAPKADQAQPDGDAVMQWAHALVRGDIKEVKLEQGGDGVGPREMAAQKLAQGSAVDKSLLSQQLGQSADKADAKAAFGAGTAVEGQRFASTQALAQATQEAPKEGAAFGLQAKVPASADSAMFKAGIPSNATSNLSINVPAANTQAKSGGQNSDGKPQGKSMTSQKGSDFLLDKSVDHQVSNADFRSSFGAMAAGYTTHAAVVKGHELGQPGDSRVQPQTLQYVADKVSELKANGGGRLHVALNPGNLGTIEINVGMRAGQVHVQVSASNPDTLKMLQGSKADLVGKLANISNPVVEIGAKHDVALKAEHRAEVLKPFTSESFVTAHRADSPISVDTKVSSTEGARHSIDAAANAESSMGMSSREHSSSQFSSDQGQSQPHPQFERSFNAATDQGEGREKAFEKWEQSFKGRKSA